MAKAAAKANRQGARAGLLTKVLILALLVGMGWTLYRQQGRVAEAQAQLDQLNGEVQALQQENDALAKDISEGVTQEKLEELAREHGYAKSGERIFIDVSN